MSTKETSADKTKYRLAEAAKKCMASSGTDAMTVTQIVQTCGVTRQTFYRNFQDKYDLINWYFDKLLLESFAQMGDGLTVYEEEQVFTMHLCGNLPTLSRRNSFLLQRSAMMNRIL